MDSTSPKPAQPVWLSLQRFLPADSDASAVVSCRFSWRPLRHNEIRDSDMLGGHGLLVVNRYVGAPTRRRSVTSRRRSVTSRAAITPVSYTHLRAHETVLDLVC